jgi:type I restriction enzyme S subunit
VSRWEVPDGWEWVKARDIADVIGGGTPPSKDPRNFSTDGVPWLTPADLSGYSDTYIARGARDLSERGLSKSNARILPKGTVLFTSRAPIGYCAIASQPLATNQGFKSLVLPDGVSPEFLRYYLLASKDYAESLSSGTTFRELSTARMKELEIPLAPTGEQRRIVEKIKALQEQSRRAREALSEVGPLLEQFRQSVLAAAFRGDLTADWRAAHPNVEPASELLRHIRAERRHRWEQAELIKYEAKGQNPPKNWGDRYKEPEPVDNSDLPELPVGWAWCQLGLLGDDPLNTVQTGPFGAQLHRTEFTTEGVPVIAVGNLTGIGFTRKGLYFITEKKANQLRRYDVQAGDLLFARSGATLGKVCVAPSYVNDWHMTGHILRARLNRAFVLPEIVAFALWGEPTVKSDVTRRIRCRFATHCAGHDVPIEIMIRKESRSTHERLGASATRNARRRSTTGLGWPALLARHASHSSSCRLR